MTNTLTNTPGSCYLLYRHENQPRQVIRLGSRQRWLRLLDLMIQQLLTYRAHLAKEVNFSLSDTQKFHDYLTSWYSINPVTLPSGKQREQIAINFSRGPHMRTSSVEPKWVDSYGVPIDMLDRIWLGEDILTSDGYFVIGNDDSMYHSWFRSLLLTSYLRLLARHFPGAGIGCGWEINEDGATIWQPQRPLRLRWQPNPSLPRQSKWEGLESILTKPKVLDRLGGKITETPMFNRAESLWYEWLENVICVGSSLVAETKALSPQDDFCGEKLRWAQRLWQVGLSLSRILGRYDQSLDEWLVVTEE